MTVEVVPTSNGTTVFAGANRDTGADVVDQDASVEVHFHVQRGHLASETRADLVSAVFDLPEVRECRRLHASLPLGDSELIDQIRRRCASFDSHAAGVSCIIDAELVTDHRAKVS